MMKTNAQKKTKDLTDDELIERIKQGDDIAFSQLVTRHEAKVYNLSRRILRNVELAEDITQETFIMVFRKLDLFQGRSSFSSWLYRVTSNLALMKLRELKHCPLREADEIEDQYASSIADATALDLYWASEIRAVLNKAIDNLHEDYREAFILRDVHGIPAQEAIEILGLTLPALKSRLHRARLDLRIDLNKFWANMI